MRHNQKQCDPYMLLLSSRIAVAAAVAIGSSRFYSSLPQFTQLSSAGQGYGIRLLSGIRL